jgi:hypothetical protein
MSVVGPLWFLHAAHRSSPGQPGQLGAARPAVGGRRRPHCPPGREPPGGAGLARHAARPGRRVGDALAGAGVRPRRRAGGDRLRHPQADGAPDDAGWCRPRVAGQAAGPDGARPRGAPHHPGRGGPAQTARAPPVGGRSGAPVPIGTRRDGDRGGPDRRAGRPGRAGRPARPAGRRLPDRRLHARHRRGAPGRDGTPADRRARGRQHRPGGNPGPGAGPHGDVRLGAAPSGKRCSRSTTRPPPRAGQSRS